MIGRFLSIDPVAANSGTGSNFNRYKYAANNPYRFTDPDGRYECSGGKSSACAVVDRAVETMQKSLTGLKSGTSEHSRLSAALTALGAKGEKTGIVFKPQALRGDGVFARAGKNGTIRIDTNKIERGLAGFSAANPGMSAGQISNALGGAAVTHEVQHVMDYRNPALGYPTNRSQEMANERSAYTTQAAFDQGLNFNSAVWNGQLGSDQQAQWIEDAATKSTNNWCKTNGC